MATLRINPVKKSVPVEMEIDGNVLLYTVREFTGSQREAYFEKQAKKYVTDKEGNVQEVKDYKGMYSTLLALTVYDADGKLVPESTIQEWSDSAQKALVEVAREVCGMGEKEADPKKD
jgi:hypothetical protein